MEKQELKPCTVCAKGRLEQGEDPCPDSANVFFTVKCLHCGHSITEYGLMPDVKNETIKRWSTRPIEDHQAAIIAAQARLIKALGKHLQAEHAIERAKMHGIDRDDYQPEVRRMNEAIREERQARADLDALSKDRL